MTLYIIRYGNYEPAEILSIWCKKSNAEKRLSELNHGNSMLEIDTWETEDNPEDILKGE